MLVNPGRLHVGLALHCCGYVAPLIALHYSHARHLLPKEQQAKKENIIMRKMLLFVTLSV